MYAPATSTVGWAEVVSNEVSGPVRVYVYHDCAVPHNCTVVHHAAHVRFLSVHAFAVGI